MALHTTRLSSAGRGTRLALSQRAQAAMLSVALAVGATLPGGAVAQEADQEQEGVAAPEQAAPPDSTADPDFDPGGETALPLDVGAPDDGGGEDDSGDGPPIDIEPVTDPDAPAVSLDDPAAMPPDALGGTDEPATTTEPTSPAALPAPAPAPTPVPPPAATTPPPADADQTVGDKRHAAPPKPDDARKRQRDRTLRRPAIRVTIPAPAETPAPVAPTPVATTAAEPVQAKTSKPRDRARPGQRAYTVRPGDSLWEIASELLGAGATDAELVAESNRLYRLNRDRIGSDPNILIAGTVLRLG